MDIRPLRTDADLAWALKEIKPYFDVEPEPGTPDADRFDVLADLIEAYEAKYHSIGLPHPIEAIKIRMGDKGLNQRGLAEMTRFPESKISEVLAEKRPLSLNMIRQISVVLDLPIELLAQLYGVAEPQPISA